MFKKYGWSFLFSMLLFSVVAAAANAQSPGTTANSYEVNSAYMLGLMIIGIAVILAICVVVGVIMVKRKQD